MGLYAFYIIEKESLVIYAVTDTQELSDTVKAQLGDPAPYWIVCKVIDKGLDPKVYQGADSSLRSDEVYNSGRYYVAESIARLRHYSRLQKNSRYA